ncbi:MAG: hypothetical protein PHS57_01905 [Alphaproteobacteria bacterium]|nr:hypothetical protein [Alphaproteobacteria bacterium]
MTLEVLAELSGGSTGFENKFGLSLEEAQMVSILNNNFKSALIAWPMQKLMNPHNWQEFKSGNENIVSHLKPSKRNITNCTL